MTNYNQITFVVAISAIGEFPRRQNKPRGPNRLKIATEIRLMKGFDELDVKNRAYIFAKDLFPSSATQKWRNHFVEIVEQSEIISEPEGTKKGKVKNDGDFLKKILCEQIEEYASKFWKEYGDFAIHESYDMGDRLRTGFSSKDLKTLASYIQSTIPKQPELNKIVFDLSKSHGEDVITNQVFNTIFSFLQTTLRLKSDSSESTNG